MPDSPKEPPNPKKRVYTGRTGYFPPLKQATTLQALLLKDAENEKITPIHRAALARAWCELEETKRKLKMKPLPGSLRPDALPKKNRTKPTGPLPDEADEQGTATFERPESKAFEPPESPQDLPADPTAENPPSNID